MIWYTTTNTLLEPATNIFNPRDGYFVVTVMMEEIGASEMLVPTSQTEFHFK